MDNNQPACYPIRVRVDQYIISLEADGQALTQEISLFAEEGDSCVIAVGRLDQAGQLRIEGNGYSDCTA